MSIKTFEWKLNAGASSEIRHANTKTQYGDGYAQRVSTGINNKRTDWTGSKSGDLETVIKPIVAFLDEHKGTIPFKWTDPLGNTGKYVCDTYPVKQRVGNSWQIDLKFEQVF
ncbi:phage tail protein [Moraxella bovis]|uniref:phage tail protein n=1 Tax=Moraxella bovis TaxID=476 RepID=UPI0022261068|nr:phage tail protein [Moraxella bovis]UZA15844.1 phage tail protein [Moraxella bovis]